MGASFASGVVLSDAGAVNTFERLLPADLPAVESLRGRLRALGPSTAHIEPVCGLVEERRRAWG